MRQRCETEIHELHAFFTAWFNGDLADSDGISARFESVMAPDVEMVTPGGGHLDRCCLVDDIRKAHGESAATPVRIWIEKVSVRPVRPGIWLATYQEWQQAGGPARGRLSTALFEDNPSAPNGLLWRHIHEVWLPTS